MECENTLGDRKMCTSSEGNAKIQPHTHGHVRSTSDWSWRDKNANRGNVALFRQKRRTPWSWYRNSFVQKRAISLLEWSSVSDRIITARFESRFKKVSIIMFYAPTNTSEEKDNSFYAQLQSVLDKLPNRDMLILLGDMNAKVGADNTDREREMGKHGLEKMNENGEMLADFCSTNSLVIGGTIFSHRKCHKAWLSPDKLTENQIDHVMVSKRYISSLQDVRVRGGADIGSNHHLVVTKIKMNIHKKESAETKKKVQCQKTKTKRHKANFSVFSSQPLRSATVKRSRNSWAEMVNIQRSSCGSMWRRLGTSTFQKETVDQAREEKTGQTRDEPGKDSPTETASIWLTFRSLKRSQKRATSRQTNVLQDFRWWSRGGG